MTGLKRTVTTRSARLKARQSPYNSSVTLFEPEDASDSPSEPAQQSTSGPKPSSPRKKNQLKSPKKPKPIPTALEVPHPPPQRWKETYDSIRQMRERISAPVDTMGCDQAQWKETDPKSRRLATLISLMLSSQTKDEVTDAAVSKLRDALGGNITLDALLEADQNVIAEAICKVGFWRRKAEYIKKTAQCLRDNFDSDVPKTVDDLCSLPGVGPKMAFLALHVAWDLNVGIGVDVHVHRITNRLGWHKPPTKTPEETRLNLQSWLPTDLHRHINHMLVGFGQVVCLPVNPRCDACDLSTSGLCPSAKLPQPKTKSKRKNDTRTSRTIAKDDLASPKIEIAVEGDVDVKPSPSLPSESADNAMEGLYVIKTETTSW